MVFDLKKIEKGAEYILEGLNVDKKDKNFLETPKRVAKMYSDLCEGLEDSGEKIKCICEKHFPSNYKGIVAIDNIITYSLCPHHLLPVRYRIDVGYIPNEKVIGLSKLPRLIVHLSKRPVLQEQLTHDIVEMIEKNISPKGTICYVRGEHSCVMCRGVKQDQSKCITSDVRGIFSTDNTLELKFLNMVNEK